MADFNCFFNEVFDFILRKFNISSFEIIKESNRFSDYLTEGSLENWRSSTRRPPKESMYKTLKESLRAVLYKKFQERDYPIIISDFDKIFLKWKLEGDDFSKLSNQFDEAMIDYVLGLLDIAFYNQNVSREEITAFVFNNVIVDYRHKSNNTWRLKKTYEVMSRFDDLKYVEEGFCWHISAKKAYNPIPVEEEQFIIEKPMQEGYHIFHICFNIPAPAGEYRKGGYIMDDLEPFEEPPNHLSHLLLNEYKSLMLKMTFSKEDKKPVKYELYKSIAGRSETISSTTLSEILENEELTISEKVSLPKLGVEYGIKWYFD